MSGLLVNHIELEKNSSVSTSISIDLSPHATPKELKLAVDHEFKQSDVITSGSNHIKESETLIFNECSAVHDGSVNTIESPIHLIPARSMPEIIVDPSSHSFFRGRLKDLANKTIGHLHKAALNNYLMSPKIELLGYSDPEYLSSELVIIQFVVSSAEVALNYWDRLGEYIYSWVSTLEPRDKQLFEDTVSIEVRWGG